MRVIHKILVSVLFLAMPLDAQAGALSAEQGLEILARAKAADSRCRVLSAAERAELSRYQARAERAAANLMASAAATAASKSGEAMGGVQPCDDATRLDIVDTLQAARGAAAHADGEPASAQAAVPAEKLIPSDKHISLSTYSELIKPYYVDLRCRQLGRQEARSYWKAVVRLQGALVKRFGTSAVASAQSQARSGASGVSCSASSLKMAQAGLNGILQR